MGVIVLRVITVVIGWLICEELGFILVGGIERKSSIKSAPRKDKAKEDTDSGKHLEENKEN